MGRPDHKEQNLFLITGATGSVGRHLVDQLLERGQHVRALTRDPSKTNLPDSVDVISGDLTKPETLVNTFSGVTGMHLITISGESFEPLQKGPEIVKMAENAGLKRITVLWSGMEGSVEQAVKASDLAWTILQPQEFMKNTLEWAESIREKGVVRAAFGDRLTAMIHEADIAAVAATALTEHNHHGKEYILTGPEALTIKDAVNILSETIGRKIRFEELTEEQVRIQITETGIEEEAAEFILSWYRDTPPEGYTVVPTVEEVTGRPPRTFQQWVAEHAKHFK